ncbi:MAG: MobF family relaxase [Acidiferrobacter thiooxydans]
MLSFPKGGLKGSAKDIVKYVQNERDAERQTGYYSTGGAPSEWGGEIARELGLSGNKVGSKDFLSLLEGRLPDGTVFAETSPDRRMGKDLTANAPKSCSIAANAGDARLRQILIEGHEHANRRMMQFVEKEFVTARYGKGGKDVERTGQAIWASHRHEDARTAGEPSAYMHIHTHNVLLNVTRGRNGELRALDIDFGPDGVHLAGAVYQAAYANYLRERGVDLRRTENGWELACITDEQIRECSPRSAQIEAELARQGLDRKSATATQKSAANKSTRGSKSQLSQDEQRWEWRAVCQRIGVDLTRAYKRVLGRDGVAQVQEPDYEPVSAADALKYATDHLSERESVINKQSTQLHALRAGYLDGVTIDVLNEEIDAAHATGDLIDAGAGRLVTRETLAREASNLAAVAAGRNTMAPLTDEAGALARIAERERINKFEFTKSQREAVLRVLTTSDQCIVVRGAAGTGKSTALAAIADEAKAHGYRVVGTGPSQTAVDGTLDANPDDARTLASFCMREEKDDTPRLILMDEAGMVSSRDMEAFFRKVRPQDKIVYTGDDLQLAAVEAGSPMAQFMKEGVVEVVEIDEIVRQKDAGLLAVAQAFADGRNEEAVQLAAPYMTTVTVTDDDYQAAKVAPEPAAQQQDVPEATEDMVLYVSKLRDKAADQGQDLPPLTATDFRTVRKWLDEYAPKRLGLDDEKSAGKLAPQAVRVQAIAREAADAYLKLSPEERAKTLVLAATNEMRRAINSRVKAGLQDHRQVASATVTALDKSQCTKAQLREAINYKTGMVLRVPEGRGRAKKVVDWTITASDPTRNTVTVTKRDGEEKVFRPRALNPKETGLYAKRDLALNTGDRVVFTENRRGDGYQNNETGTVIAAGADKVVIRKDDGKVIDLAAGDMHAVDHGWAVTVHRSQGRTIDRAFVAGMASKMATAALAYVSCTRERYALRIFTDHVKSLQKSWARVAERETAKDAVETAAHAQETAPLDAAREAVRAQVAEQEKAHQQEQQTQETEREPEAKTEKGKRQREQDFEMEM